MSEGETNPGVTLAYSPCCEICGADHPQRVTPLDLSPLYLCHDCARLFGFTYLEHADGRTA
jgi:ribosome-binding protein aMBF1 (putative translation factor)